MDSETIIVVTILAIIFNSIILPKLLYNGNEENKESEKKQWKQRKELLHIIRHNLYYGVCFYAIFLPLIGASSIAYKKR